MKERADKQAPNESLVDNEQATAELAVVLPILPLVIIRFSVVPRVRKIAVSMVSQMRAAIKLEWKLASDWWINQDDPQPFGQTAYGVNRLVLQ